jgi:hypothetical protein
MRFTAVLLVVAIATGCLLGTISYSQDSDKQQPQDKKHHAANELENGQDPVQVRAAAARDRSQQIEKLVAFIGKQGASPRDRESSSEAIRLLGDLFAVEAVDTLCEFLSFTSDDPKILKTTSGDEALELDRKYPAVESLIKIGMSAAPGIVKYFGAHEADTRQLWNAAVALAKGFGDSDLAARYLDGSISKLKAAEAKARLEKLRKVFKENYGK